MDYLGDYISEVVVEGLGPEETARRLVVGLLREWETLPLFLVAFNVDQLILRAGSTAEGLLGQELQAFVNRIMPLVHKTEPGLFDKMSEWPDKDWPVKD